MGTGCSSNNSSPEKVITNLFLSVEKNDPDLFLTCFSESDLSKLKGKMSDEDFDAMINKILNGMSSDMKKEEIRTSEISIEQPDNYQELSYQTIPVIIREETLPVPVFKSETGNWYIELDFLLLTFSEHL
jgi:hypothetical protein